MYPVQQQPVEHTMAGSHARLQDDCLRASIGHERRRLLRIEGEHYVFAEHKGDRNQRVTEPNDVNEASMCSASRSVSALRVSQISLRENSRADTIVHPLLVKGLRDFSVSCSRK